MNYTIMKKLLIVLGGIFLVIIILADQWQIKAFQTGTPEFLKVGNGVIHANEAKNHIGENVIVSGTISEISIINQTTNVYLYLDGDIKNAQFAAVWPGTNNPPIKELKELIFRAEPIISVRGKIVVEKNLPEIVVNSWDQINQSQ
jgi:hypothetical protein